jgi:hypothetical protein
MKTSKLKKDTYDDNLRTDDFTKLKNTLESKISSPTEFFTELRSIWSKEISKNEKQLCKLLLELQYEKDFDICSMAVKAIDDGLKIWDIIHILEVPFPDFKLNKNSIIKLIKKCHADLVDGQQCIPIGSLAKKQPGFSKQLLQELLSQKETFIAYYISSIFLAFSEKNFKKSHSELIKLGSHKSTTVIQGITFALGYLNYSLPKDKLFLDKTFSLFDQISNRNNEKMSTAVCAAISPLISISKKAINRIVTFSKSNNPLIMNPVSAALFRSAERMGGHKWFRTCLMNLSNTSCEHIGILNQLDHAMYILINKNKNWKLVEDFVSDWIIQSDYYDGNYKIDKIFRSTVSAFTGEKLKFEIMITRFLNSDHFKHNRIASELIDDFHLHTKISIELSKETLDTLSFDDVLYVSRKILGYVYDPKLLCSLIYSLLTIKESNKVKELVSDIFINHIGADFPKSTYDFLKSVKENTDENDLKYKTAEIVLGELDRYYDLVKSLPPLKELLSTKQQTYQILIEEKKLQANAMEAVDEDSIVHQLMGNPIPLKYGKGWFSYRDGSYSSPESLGRFSYSAEISRSEILHPITSMIKKFNFRLVKRGDK